MKFNLLLLCIFACTNAVWAEDFNLREELNPKVENDQVEVRTYKHDGDNATITEYRSGGKTWMIKVQPAGGFPPYYLYDDEGTGVFKRRVAGNEMPKPPMWVIKRF